MFQTLPRALPPRRAQGPGRQSAVSSHHGLGRSGLSIRAQDPTADPTGPAPMPPIRGGGVPPRARVLLTAAPPPPAVPTLSGLPCCACRKVPVRKQPCSTRLLSPPRSPPRPPSPPTPPSATSRTPRGRPCASARHPTLTPTPARALPPPAQSHQRVIILSHPLTRPQTPHACRPQQEEVQEDLQGRRRRERAPLALQGDAVARC